MSDTMNFDIEFHSGFRVATGVARAGIDATVDPDDPLPASAIKGLMRAVARTLLPWPVPGPGHPLVESVRKPDHPLVEAVFGGPREPSPWNWSSATGGEASTRVRANVRVADGGSAEPDMLRLSEEVWWDRASFTITQYGPLTDADLVARHRLLLACAAQGVHHLGSDRRRGLGWVSVRSCNFEVDAAAVDALLSYRDSTLPQLTHLDDGEDVDG